MGENNSRLKPLLPIGIFDSGIGGLSVLQAIQALLPTQPTIYLGDQVHVPYGSRPLEQVRAFSKEITRFLLNQGTGLIVVACNTASAAALHHLRMTFPNTPFVGMEPAVKPAAENTLTGVVGVLATPATFQSELYASVVERFAQGVKVLQNPCPGLVDQIEKGKLDDSETMQILHKAIDPMLEQNVDTIVIGCTHYPFVIPQIRQIAGDSVRVIDPAPAIAKQVARLLQEHGWLAGRNTGLPNSYYTTGSSEKMQALVEFLCSQTVLPVKISWGKELSE
jgi:glutamate racemase